MLVGFHFHVSFPSASGSSTSSISSPARSDSTPTPATTWPSTIIFSFASSTAAIANGTKASLSTCT